MSLIRALRSLIRLLARAVVRLFRFGLKASVVILIISLFTYAVLNIWYYSGEVQIKRDVVAEMTSKARAASPVDRAWPIYREAMLVLGSVPKMTTERLNPEHPQWGSYRDFVEQRRVQIELIRIGASKDSFGFIPGAPFDGPGLRSERNGGWERRLVNDGVLDTTELFDAVANAITVTRSMVGILLLDAAVAEADGESDRILRNLIAAIHIADQSREIPLMICDLTAIANFNRVRVRIDELLHRAPELFSDEQLGELELALMSFMGGAIEGRLNPERMVIDDMVQRSFTDDGNGDGHAIRPRVTAGALVSSRVPDGRWASLLGPIDLLYMPSRRMTVEAIDDFYVILNDSAGRPFHLQSDKELIKAFDDLTFGPDGSIYHHVPYLYFFRMLRWGELNRMLITLPPVMYYSAHQLATLLRDQTIAVIAMERYRRDHGAWPHSLDALVPEYLDALPIDVFDAQPIRYRIDDEIGPILYSIGSNLEDDGGVYAIDEDGAPTNYGSRRWIGNRVEVRRLRRLVRAGGHSSKLTVEADYVLWPSLSRLPGIDVSESGAQ